MTTFLDFTITGDPAFDFFFSVTASGGLLVFLVTLPLLAFRGRL